MMIRSGRAANWPTYVRRWAVLLLLLSPLIVFISSQAAIQADRNASLVSHTRCMVLDKQLRDDKYRITTSCGDFETSSKHYNAIEVGNEYEIDSTPGNWARTARIVMVIPSY
jgi:hypothetical protein